MRVLRTDEVGRRMGAVGGVHGIEVYYPDTENPRDVAQVAVVSGLGERFLLDAGGGEDKPETLMLSATAEELARSTAERYGVPVAEIASHGVQGPEARRARSGTPLEPQDWADVTLEPDPDGPGIRAMHGPSGERVPCPSDAGDAVDWLAKRRMEAALESGGAAALTTTREEWEAMRESLEMAHWSTHPGVAEAEDLHIERTGPSSYAILAVEADDGQVSVVTEGREFHRPEDALREARKVAETTGATVTMDGEWPKGSGRAPGIDDAGRHSLARLTLGNVGSLQPAELVLGTTGDGNGALQCTAWAHDEQGNRTPPGIPFATPFPFDRDLAEASLRKMAATCSPAAQVAVEAEEPEKGFGGQMREDLEAWEAHFPTAPGVCRNRTGHESPHPVRLHPCEAQPFGGTCACHELSDVKVVEVEVGGITRYHVSAVLEGTGRATQGERGIEGTETRSREQAEAMAEQCRETIARTKQGWEAHQQEEAEARAGAGKAYRNSKVRSGLAAAAGVGAVVFGVATGGLGPVAVGGAVGAIALVRSLRQGARQRQAVKDAVGQVRRRWRSGETTAQEAQRRASQAEKASRGMDGQRLHGEGRQRQVLKAREPDLSGVATATAKKAPEAPAHGHRTKIEQGRHRRRRARAQGIGA